MTATGLTCKGDIILRGHKARGLVESLPAHTVDFHRAPEDDECFML